MDTENEKVIAERSKRIKVEVITCWIALLVVCPLIVNLACDGVHTRDVIFYSVMTVILFVALIWRTVQMCAMPKILILYKNGKFYLYPDKKTEIELEPRQIRRVEYKNYRGMGFSRYASLSGKLFITYDKGFTSFSFVQDVSCVREDIDAICSGADFVANDTAKTDENLWS